MNSSQPPPGFVHVVLISHALLPDRPRTQYRIGRHAIKTEPGVDVYQLLDTPVFDTLSAAIREALRLNNEFRPSKARTKRDQATVPDPYRLAS